jgi:hypothetical protein
MLLLWFLREKIVHVVPRGRFSIRLTGAVAFVAMVIFNPFHLTNLTHTFGSPSASMERCRTHDGTGPSIGRTLSARRCRSL